MHSWTDGDSMDVRLQRASINETATQRQLESENEALKSELKRLQLEGATAIRLPHGWCIEARTHVRDTLNLMVTDTSSSALWFGAALLQLAANVMLVQSEFGANATLQHMASAAWMCASLAHAWALRSLATGATLYVHVGLNVGSALFCVSEFMPPPPDPTVFVVVLAAAAFYMSCAFLVSRTSPLHKVRRGAACFVAGAGTTGANMLCNIFWPSAPLPTLRVIGAGVFLVAGGYTWTTVVAEREFAAYAKLSEA